LINTYYARAEKLGIKVMYDAKVDGLEVEDGLFKGAEIVTNDHKDKVSGRSIVIASGGFEANINWLKEYWGDAANNFIIRGSRFNDGRVLKMLMQLGAKTTGDPREMHAVAVDARSPVFDCGIISRMDSLPLGIVVNKLGRRFYDEGEDLWPKRYAIWGKLIAEQPDQIAYSIIDCKVLGKFLPPLFDALKSDTIQGLAKLLDVDRATFAETVSAFNSHVSSNSSSFNPRILDECKTTGLEPPKSHWAIPLDAPPFLA